MNKCHFCGHPEAAVGPLIEGGSADRKVHICGGCIAWSAQALEDRRRRSLPREARLSKIPTPPQIVANLDRHVIGQEVAKRRLALAVSNHHLRLFDAEQRAMRTGLVQPDHDPLANVVLGKSNVLLLGPTGSGKTLLVRSLAEALDVPLAIGDATTYTEAGYVGEDVEGLLLKLIQAADYDIALAQRGIVYIDEIDKIRRTGGHVSLTRDVSGEGVQQALLKLIEGTVANVPPQGGRKHPEQQYLQIDTSEILFICGGAFVGLEGIIRRRLGRGGFGFEAAGREVRDADLLRHSLPCDLEAYGMIPELLGRLPVVAYLDELDVDALARILTEPEDALINQYRKLVRLRGADLEFTTDAIKTLAERAIERGTGARGLRAAVEKVMERVLYDFDGGVTYVITHESVLGGEVERRRPTPIRFRRPRLSDMTPPNRATKV